MISQIELPRLHFRENRKNADMTAVANPAA